MYFGPVEVAATTRWRRAFNLELMNESSRDWTANVLSYFWNVTLENDAS